MTEADKQEVIELIDQMGAAIDGNDDVEVISSVEGLGPDTVTLPGIRRDSNGNFLNYIVAELTIFTQYVERAVNSVKNTWQAWFGPVPEETPTATVQEQWEILRTNVQTATTAANTAAEGAETATEAADAATEAAEAATDGAENVDATVNGYVITVTDRDGDTHQINLKPDIDAKLDKISEEDFDEIFDSEATEAYKGSYNLVTDLNLTLSATRVQIATALGTAISGEENGDYAYVMIPFDASRPVYIEHVERYSYNGTAWAFDYVYNRNILDATGDGIFDISAYHADGGALVRYADLAAALGTNGANVPESERRGGMTVRFVSGVTGEYEQWRLLSDTFNTTVSNWQGGGVDDEPTAGSDNLVKSGGVYSMLATIEEELGIPIKTEVTESVPVTWAGAGFIRNRAADDRPEGSVKTWEGGQYSDFILIDKYKTLTYMRMKSTSASSSILAGVSFYSEASESAVLVGKSIPYIPNAGERGYENQTIIVPKNAKYIRFSCYDEYVDIFTCEGKYTDYTYSDGLGKQVNDLEEITHNMQESVASIDKQVDDLEEVIGGDSAEEFVTTPLSVSFIDDGAIFAVDASDFGYNIGSVDTRSDTKETNKYSDYVDIRDYLNKDSKLIYLNMLSTSIQSNILLGACFYNSNYEPILGVPYKGDSEVHGAEISTIDIPTNAAYIRFSVRKTFESEFTANVKHLETVHNDGMLKDIDDLKIKTDAIENEISIKIIDNSCINYTNGNAVTSSEYSSTNYVKIRGFEKFSIPSFTVSAPSNIGLAFYNRNKQYISGVHYPYKNFGYSFIRYIAPAEACYVRFTVIPNTTPYINIESQAPIAPYFNTYLAFNTPQEKGHFKIFMNFNNGVMLGSCGNDKISSNDDVLIYRSTDWGITWAYLGNATQEETLQLREGIYYGDHDGNGNAVLGSGDLGDHYLLKVTNYGESWPSDYKVVANATFINNLVGVNTNGVENVVYCGNNKYRAFCNSMGGFTGHNAVIESNDGGETWYAAESTQPLLASLRSVYKDSKGVLWGAGMHGNRGVWKSTDNGLNWDRKSEFLAFQSIIEYNGYLFCGAMNPDTTEGYVYRSADNGETWDKVLTITKFTPIYHRTFIPYKNILIAVFCQGEGSTSVEVSWQASLDNGNTWCEITHTGSYEGGFVELACVIGDIYYINTHGGLQKM